MDITVTLRGKAAIKAAIAKLPESVREHHMEGIETTARAIVAEARARAPLLKHPAKGRRPGDLKNAIDFSLSPSTLSAKVGISKKSKVRYGHLVEYGTAARQWKRRRHPGKSTGVMPRKPFMAPAVEAERPYYEQRMRRAATQVERDLTVSRLD